MDNQDQEDTAHFAGIVALGQAVNTARDALDRLDWAVDERNLALAAYEAFSLQKAANEVAIAAHDALQGESEKDTIGAWITGLLTDGWMTGSCSYTTVVGGTVRNAHGIVSPCGRWCVPLRHKKTTITSPLLTHRPSGFSVPRSRPSADRLREVSDRLGEISDKEKATPRKWIESLDFSLQEMIGQ